MRAIFVTGLLVLGISTGCGGEAEEEGEALGSAPAGLMPSCDGLPETCGADGAQDCCASIAVPAGQFTLGRGAGDPDDCACTTCSASCGGCGSFSCNANESPGSAASVSAFRLDRFEVTVGRFRKWVQAGAPEPAAGAGRHAHLAGGQLVGETGWDTAWPIATDFNSALFCSTPWSMWTSVAGPNENRPINCVNWYEAYAFCIWDGGFLPTEAEWEYAASGGEERVYPWSAPPGATTIDPTYAVYGCVGDGQAGCSAADMLAVGFKPPGAGRWGHEDQAGSMLEWALDWGGSAYPAACTDCYQSPSTMSRAIRGGYWGSSASDVLVVDRGANGPSGRNPWFGFRCARGPEPAIVEGTVTLEGVPLGGVTVFVDLDGDATLDQVEPSATSAAGTGAYTIEGVPEGTGDVRLINPDPAAIEILSPATGFHAISVVDGDVVPGLDFALGTIAPPATVDGTVSLLLPNGSILFMEGITVFADLDGDALLDAGEPSTTTTAPLFGFGGGDYHLEGIPAGAADIHVVNSAPESVFIATPVSGSYAVVVADGEELTDRDFVFEPHPAPATVEGRVALDFGNGTVVGMAGVTVFADLDSDGALDPEEPSAVSEEPFLPLPFAGGDYVLEGIPAGPVDIRVINPTPDDAFLASPASGSYPLVVADGDALTGYDFVLELNPPPATVKGVVVLDAGTGTVLPIGGVTVFADLDGNGVLDPSEPSAVTAEPLLGSFFTGGDYSLVGIPAGPVDIRLVDDAPDDLFIAEPATEVHSIVVADGDELTGYDFVFQPVPPPAVVEGHVWVSLNGGLLAPVGDIIVFADLDGDGVLGDGEPSDESAPTGTANPFSGGAYRIEGIPAGDVDIRVEVTAPLLPLDPANGVHSITVADGDVMELEFSLQLPAPPPAEEEEGEEEKEGTCAMVPHRTGASKLPVGLLTVVLLAMVARSTRRRRSSPWTSK